MTTTTNNSPRGLMVAIVCTFAVVGCGRMSEPSDKTTRAAHAARDDAGVSDAPTRRLVTRSLTRRELRDRMRRPAPEITPGAAAPDELGVVSRIIPLLLNAASATDKTLLKADGLARTIKMRVEIWRVLGHQYAALVELPEAHRGAGLYVFRLASRAPAQATVVLQAPHSYHDVGTLVIARKVFFASSARANFRALYVNTAHRYQQSPGDRRQLARNPADVTHNANHWFTAATRALDNHQADLRIIQLHGFAAQSSESNVAAIISTAGPRSPAVTSRYANALASVFATRVLRYPEDTRRLGGTTNVQRKALTGSSTAEFVHLEMSASSRTLLRKTLAATTALARALYSVAATNAPDPADGGLPR